MASTFSAQVSAFVAKSEKRMEMVTKEAAQRVGLEVKDRTPVDTGFLRASFMASTAAMPVIDRNARPSPGGAYADPASEIALVIAGASLGQTIYMGFVASYAYYVEVGANGRSPVGMVGLAAQQWPQIVNDVVAEAKARIP
jgi:hypothetical protein|tara:strand:- start:12205 stop:12627 length:423 start_codon:yes stop_codon:yes gene_type:complete